jgi:DNA-binding protein HU-beta
MRKEDLIKKIAQETGIPKVDVLVILETYFKEVKESLSEGEPVFIRGFGSFNLKVRAKKVGRNIRDNTALEVPEHSIPVFRPAAEFNEAVKKSKAMLKANEQE